MIPFIDLQYQQSLIKDKLDASIQKVLSDGAYIMGPEVKELEEALSKFSAARHVVTCGNGTDALLVAAMALGVKPNDVIFIPAFTFPATPEAIMLLQAVPYFVDVSPDTFNMNPTSLKEAIKDAVSCGYKPKGIISVDLFGQPADYDEISVIAKENGLWLIDDAAQGFGANYKGRPVGTLADITTTSFFPAKPLGCYGDGGALFTNSDELANVMRSIRVHGKGTDKYDNVRIGMNSRLDTIQAAILLEKLKLFPQELQQRQILAELYQEAFSNCDGVVTPTLSSDRTSSWAQYTLKLDDENKRQDLMLALKEKGIPTAVYYPTPLHHQTGYKDICLAHQNLSVSESLCKRVLSLPMHPHVEGVRPHIGVMKEVLQNVLTKVYF